MSEERRAVDREDVLAEVDGFLFFRRDNHWDWDVMVSEEYERSGNGYLYAPGKTRMLPLSVREFYEMSDEELRRFC